MSFLDGIFGGSSDDDQKMMDEIKAYRDLVLANRPQQLSAAGTYTPEDWDFERAQYNLISEDPTYKAKQAAALDELQGLSQSGLSAADRAVLAQANQNASAQASSEIASIRDAMARRGQSGSGQELAMKLAAQQQASNQGARAAQNQAALAAQQKEAYRQAYLQGLASQRQQDYQAQAANTGIINQFNAANTQGQNAYNAAIAGSHNQAGLMNYQLPYQLQQQNIANQNQWLGNAGNAYGDMTKGYAAQAAAHQGNSNAWLQGLFNIGGALGSAYMQNRGQSGGAGSTDSSSPSTTYSYGGGGGYGGGSGSGYNLGGGFNYYD